MDFLETGKVHPNRFPRDVVLSGEQDRFVANPRAKRTTDSIRTAAGKEHRRRELCRVLAACTAKHRESSAAHRSSPGTQSRTCRGSLRRIVHICWRCEMAPVLRPERTEAVDRATPFEATQMWLRQQSR